MDYEKMYKEALERARANYKADKEMGFLENCDMLERIFPELAESDDERIRIELVAFFKGMQDSDWHEKYWHDLEIDRILAYLEKQKEQEQEWSEEDVEAFIQKKLSGLTEFEEGLVTFYNKRNEIPSDKDGVYNKHELEEFLHESAKTLLSLAKKELLSYPDESNPAIEAIADLERTFECNPDKLPIWLKNELTKRHLEGYIKGRNDALREMSDFMESHFNTQSGTSIKSGGNE